MIFHLPCVPSLILGMDTWLNSYLAEPVLRSHKVYLKPDLAGRRKEAVPRLSRSPQGKRPPHKRDHRPGHRSRRQRIDNLRAVRVSGRRILHGRLAFRRAGGDRAPRERGQRLPRTEAAAPRVCARGPKYVYSLLHVRVCVVLINVYGGRADACWYASAAWRDGDRCHQARQREAGRAGQEEGHRFPGLQKRPA